MTTDKSDRLVELPVLLERAKTLGTRLGGAADQLNASIEMAEKELAALKLGVTASTLLHMDEDGTETRLAFDRHGDVWRLIIESGNSVFENWTVSPLVNASRRTRREAVRLLPDLLSALIEEAESEIRQVEEAAQEVDQFTATVRALRSKGGKR